MIRRGIILGWALLGLVWVVGAMRAKRTDRRARLSARAVHMIGTGLAYYLMILPCHFWSLDRRVLPPTAFGNGIGFVLALAGIGFAIWARLLLGTNWSGMATLQQDHELMRTGPYAVVRHPIYTGLIAGLLGTAIVWGEVRCFLSVLLITATFSAKLRVEEGLLTGVFGDQYTRYQREVNALIPFL